MGDDAVTDPDAMWKPDYIAPGDRGERDDPEADTASAKWFANYRRGEAVAAADPGSEWEPEPAGSRADDRPGIDSPVTETGVELPDASNHAPRDRTGRRLLLAAVTMAAVAVGGVAWQIFRDDTVEGGDRLASIPARAVPTWIAELDTGHVTGVVGTRSTIVVLELVTNDLVGLSAESGTERWRVNAAPSRSIAQLAEVEGAAVVTVEESTGDRSIAAYSFESGERLWREDGLDRSAFSAFQGSIYRIAQGVTNVALERLDPRTGEGMNALAPDLSSVGWAHAATVRDDFVEVFDLQTLERVAGPIAIGDVAAASAFGGQVVGLGPDATVRLYGTNGDELASLQISTNQPDQFDVTKTPESMLLVTADQEIVGYSLSGDQIAQVWRSGPVQVNEIREVGDHTYAVVQTVVAAGPNGGPVRVVDAATGDVIAEPSGGSWVRLGRDGFVVEIADDEGVREAIEAYGYDGAQRWRFDLAREQQGVFLVDGGMVIVASDATTQKSTLTYLT